MEELKKLVKPLNNTYRFLLIMQQKVRGGKLTPDDKAFLKSLLTELPIMKEYILKLLEDHDLSEDYKRQYGELIRSMINPLHEREQNFIEFVAILSGLFEEFSKSFKVSRTHAAKSEFESEIAKLVETRKRVVGLGVGILPVSDILHPGGYAAGAGAGAGSASAPPPPKAAAAAAPPKSRGKKASAPAAAAPAAALSNAPDCIAGAGGAGCEGPAVAAPLVAAEGAPPPPPPPPGGAAAAAAVEPPPPPPSNAPSLDGGRRRRHRTRRRIQKTRRSARKTLRRRR